MSRHVFISHSSHDASYVERIRSHLEARGIRCWMAPRDIPPGADWAESIMRALAEARAMVIVLSSRSNQSAQVRREVEHAVDAGVSIIPIIVDDTEPSVALRYYISSHQWMDASKGLDRAFLDRLADSLEAPGEAAGNGRPTTPCPSCGAENPAGARHCTECGAKMDGKPSGKRLGWKIAAGVVLVLLLLIAGRAGMRVLGTRSAYRSARTALDEERWEDAYRGFRRLGSYSDARELAREALLGGIRQMRDSLVAVREEGRTGDRQLWNRLLEATGSFLDQFPQAQAAPEVRLARADAMFALDSFPRAADIYLALARNPDQGRGAAASARRACDALLAAMETTRDSASILQRQVEAAEVLLGLQPPPGQVIPVLDRFASTHFESGSLATAADLWRRAFLYAHDAGVQSRMADRLAQCYRAMGDSTEARRWRLLAAGDVPAPAADSTSMPPDSAEGPAGPPSSSDDGPPPGQQPPHAPGDGAGGRPGGPGRDPSPGRR